MKLLRTIALLALSIFALRGEAASSWSQGFPFVRLANRYVTFNVNVTGLGDQSATFILYGSSQSEYNYALSFLRNPIELDFSPQDLVNGQVTFTEQLDESDVNVLNNFYYEILIDADHYMFGRFGEAPGFAVTLNHIDYVFEPDTSENVPFLYYYDVNASVEYKDGYIAAFHEGPDARPTPEPTAGLLLLLGSVFLVLHRRKAV